MIGRLHYWLFLPERDAADTLGLIVMLHGCRQDPEDFARGTRMNARAAIAGLAVVYPQQTAARNMLKCWNWFTRDNQVEGASEAGAIAALTTTLVAHYALDGSHVYIAGLSAGGAMAVNVATLYPALYRAVGVHSGLAFGSAHDIPSALSAMRSGPRKDGVAEAALTQPVIVFQGDEDLTVHPSNADAIVASAIRHPGSHSEADTMEAPRGRRSSERTTHALEGRVVAELWKVRGAGHAWAGGDPTGSFTDPTGPDASATMLRFFSAAA